MHHYYSEVTMLCNLYYFYLFHKYFSLIQPTLPYRSQASLARGGLHLVFDGRSTLMSVACIGGTH